MYTFDELAGLFRKIQIGSAPFLDGEESESGRKLLAMALSEFEDMLNTMMFDELDRRDCRPAAPPVEEEAA
jgi:hypothetical protein